MSPTFEFWDPRRISEMVEATDLKFGMWVEYVSDVP